MAKEPTSPPEGAMKPGPPDLPPRREPFTALPEHLLTPEGRDKLFATKGPSVTMSMDDPAFRGHTSDPDFAPPRRVDGPDDEIVFSEARTCDVHDDCMTVTTGPVGSRTNDPGYEPPSRTNESSPDCVPITPTIAPEFQPPGERPGEAGGPFWDAPPAPGPSDFEGTIYEPYAIIKDMRGMYQDFVDDVMDATLKLRSATLKWLCRAIALTLGSVVLTLLAIGAVGVVGAVALFKVLDAAEYRYWAGKSDESYEPRERPWK